MSCEPGLGGRPRGHGTKVRVEAAAGETIKSFPHLKQRICPEEEAFSEPKRQK